VSGRSVGRRDGAAVVRRRRRGSVRWTRRAEPISIRTSVERASSTVLVRSSFKCGSDQLFSVHQEGARDAEPARQSERFRAIHPLEILRIWRPPRHSASILQRAVWDSRRWSGVDKCAALPPGEAACVGVFCPRGDSGPHLSTRLEAPQGAFPTSRDELAHRPASVFHRCGSVTFGRPATGGVMAAVTPCRLSPSDVRGP
jgi:hypothetical protein